MANLAAGLVGVMVDNRHGTAESMMAETTTNGTGLTRYGGTGVEPPAIPPPCLGIDAIAGLIRKLRRCADLSQRELAHAAQTSPSTVARIEAGDLIPSLGKFLRLLAVARLVLVVTDEDGHVFQPMRVWDDTRDGADRQFPAHLDLILDPRFGEWWADLYGLARPPETFHRDRRRRDAERRRSQRDVRGGSVDRSTS